MENQKIKVLSIHNKYKIRGGEDKSTESERDLLAENGVEVYTIDESNNKITGIRSIIYFIMSFFNVFYYLKVRRIIIEKSIDVVHVQNFFPIISPSVFFAASKLNVPTLMTIRNYRLFCSNALFFRDNKVCRKCEKKKFNFYAIKYKCYRESRLQSIYISLLFWFYDSIGAWSKVDRFILLTEFQREMFLQNGFKDKQLSVKGNFVSDYPSYDDLKLNQALYVGRLSEEKGVLKLIDIWKKQSLANKSKMTLVLAGEGPLYDKIKSETQNEKFIKVIGQVEYETVYKLMAESVVLMFTSNWFEGMPRTIIESFACGTPVISSDLGAMTTMIEDGITGYKYKNEKELEKYVDLLMKNSELFRSMKKNCFKEFHSKYEKTNNAKILIKLYKELIEEKKDD
ncbi:glycosyltransferase family 4 protein [Alteromonas sp. IB21]|uniref:glycosyltransferase family 4 protein n=1 Tax=Alteromonas sp. IB21 TaxID=2779369 RepID=UPI0018E8AF4E|nr:glycosyltransferase family 4 protein [Alteromonas sp. IB21]